MTTKPFSMRVMLINSKYKFSTNGLCSMKLSTWRHNCYIYCNWNVNDPTGNNCNKIDYYLFSLNEALRRVPAARPIHCQWHLPSFVSTENIYLYFDLPHWKSSPMAGWMNFNLFIEFKFLLRINCWRIQNKVCKQQVVIHMNEVNKSINRRNGVPLREVGRHRKYQYWQT